MFVLFFFFKQKTAYEIPKRDWSSDVCSSDLPEVRVLLPRTSVTRLPDGEVAFKFLVTDEQFAIKSVFVETRKKGVDDGDLDKRGTRTVIYDAADFGKLLPILSANLKTPAAGLHPMMGKFPFKAPELHLRHKKLDVDLVWALRGQFQEGDLVVIQINADQVAFLELPAQRP